MVAFLACYLILDSLLYFPENIVNVGSEFRLSVLLKDKFRALFYSSVIVRDFILYICILVFSSLSSKLYSKLFMYFGAIS